MSVRCIERAMNWAMSWCDVRASVRVAGLDLNDREIALGERLQSVTTFQPGGKSRWLSTSRAVHSPGSSARSSEAQALGLRGQVAPRRLGSILRSCTAAMAIAPPAR
jgi:hypothetical protein